MSTQHITAGRIAATLTVGAVLAACSHGKPPVGEMQSSRTVVQQASTADAQSLAPVELNAAQDKLRRAEEAYRSKNYRLAKTLAEEAQADAELATAKARGARADTALREVRASMGSSMQQPAVQPQGAR